MLNSHLIVQTKPMALKQNVVLWKDYRITVLDGRLFRIEQSKNLKFRDGATQTVWFRNAPKQQFTVNDNKDSLTICTKYVTLTVLPDRKDCFIIIDGKKTLISNQGNLKGTYRTLDRCDGNVYGIKGRNPEHEIKPIQLENGVCSTTGVAVHDDSKSLTLLENGQIINQRADGTDEYVFAYGSDYLSSIKALYMITGNTPIIPRFALGNWWSRYHDYSDSEYLRLLSRFEQRNVPLTVATVDMDWHWAFTIDQEKKITESGKNTAYYGYDKPKPKLYGWTGYSWNTHLFPDYKAFLKELKKRNLKTTLNLHPADGIRYCEDAYEQMALAMDVDPKTERKIPFDIANPKFVNNYFEILHKPYEKDGVDFWWIDWQQGTTSSIDGLDPLWSLNHYHYLDIAKNNSSPLILSRYSGVGAHRYPVGFSGDTVISWETLKYLTYFTPTASNVGYGWWSHDIGGHYHGVKNHELFVRHVQFGVFSPINRLHCSSDVVMTKEPWVYKNGTGAIVEEWLRLRHKLIPLLYTASRNNAEQGVTLIKPMYYEWQNKQAYEYLKQYIFADQLLVAPIYSPKNQDGYSSVEVWLPQGKWTDIFTGDKYEIDCNGKVKTLYRTLESIPVLVKEGGIIPLSLDHGNSVENPTELEMLCFSGNGKFSLYEDGRTFNSQEEFITEFKSNYSVTENFATQTLTVKGNGNGLVIPKNRKLKVVFKDVDFNGKLSLTVNGKEQSLPTVYTDNPTVTFTFKPNTEYVVTVKYQLKSKLERAIERSITVLTQGEGVEQTLETLFRSLESSTSIEEFIKTVQESTVSFSLKQRLIEEL